MKNWPKLEKNVAIKNIFPSITSCSGVNINMGIPAKIKAKGISIKGQNDVLDYIKDILSLFLTLCEKYIFLAFIIFCLL
jgi:hypothetical protein